MYENIGLWSTNSGTAPISRTPDVAAGPYGALTADRITFNSNSAEGYFHPTNIPVVNGEIYTWSGFFKQDSNQTSIKLGPDANPDSSFKVNPTDGSITTPPANFIAYGVLDYGAGWFRAWCTVRATNIAWAFTSFNNGGVANKSWLMGGIQVDQGGLRPYRKDP